MTLRINLRRRSGESPEEGFDEPTERSPMPPEGGPAVVRALPSFEAFYEREYRAVVGLAYALSGSRYAAEDITQDAFVAAHRAWEKVGMYDRPGAWVRRVVSNISVSQFRKRTREARALARIALRQSNALPALPEPDHEFWQHVRALPKRQAQAIALYYLEDRPVAEIAEILDCAENTVKVHLHKGRKALAARLGDEVES